MASSTAKKERAEDDLVPIAKDGFDIANLANVRSQWMDVTPAMASTWLKNNHGNRQLRREAVTAYARDMINGVWVPTHQGIAFNDKDVLIDGQHRLHAIVLSGKTVRLMVTFGLPSKIDGSEMTTMDAVDRGATRTVADQLTIQHGFKYGSMTATICAAMGSLCYGERTRRLSVSQTLEVYRAFEKAIDYVITHRPKERGLRSAGILAGFAFALATEENFWEGKTPISVNFDKVIHGQNVAENSPIWHLRKFLLSEESKLFTKSLDRGLAELVLQCLFLEQKGAPIEKLEMSLEGADHFRSLQPDRVSKIKGMFTLPEISKPATPAPVTQAPPAPHTPEPRKLTLINIIQVAEKHFQIGSAVLCGKGKDPEILFARVCTMSGMEKNGHGFGSIGAAFRLEPSHIQDAIASLPSLLTSEKKKERYTKFIAALNK